MSIKKSIKEILAEYGRARMSYREWYELEAELDELKKQQGETMTDYDNLKKILSTAGVKFNQENYDDTIELDVYSQENDDMLVFVFATDGTLLKVY